MHLGKYYFLGPHEEYFEFVDQEDRRLVHARSLSVDTPEKVLAHRARLSTSPEALPLILASWETVPASDGKSTLRLIPHHELVPVIDWTYWCSPTALAMVFGYWDNYVRDRRRLPGYGRLIEYWFDHAPTGHNLPDLMHKLIDPDTGSWLKLGTGVWEDNMEKSIEQTSGHHFEILATQGTLSNDWAWGDIVAEIDAGRPLQWQADVHAMAAFGYRITPEAKLVVMYNTWGDTAADQLDEWSYSLNAEDWAPKIFRLLPKDAPSLDALALVAPDGGDTLCKDLPSCIEWLVWGAAITKVDILWSTDGGNMWIPIARDLPARKGSNYHVWYPGTSTTTARVRIKGYDADGRQIAGDGSYLNFTVAGGPILQSSGTIKLLRLDGAATSEDASVPPDTPEAVLVLTSQPGLFLRLAPSPGPLAPARKAILKLVQDAFSHAAPIGLDYLKVDASNAFIVRAWLEK